MSDNGPLHVTYEGPAPLAAVLVEHIEAAGARVDWTRPEEAHGLPPDLVQQVEVGLVVWDGAATAAAGAAEGRETFLQKFPGRAGVDIEGATTEP